MTRALSVALLALLVSAPSASAGPSAKTCSDLLASISDERNRHRVALERFAVPLDKIREIATQPGTLDATSENLAKNDIRRFTFQLEALFRIYEYLPESDGRFGVWRTRVKQLEDTLGHFIDAQTDARKAGEWGAPAKVIEHLDGLAQKKKAELKSELRKQGWTGRPTRFERTAYERMMQTLKDIEWPKQGEDREYILKRLSREIKKLEDADLDMRRLEEGVHELRRKLRWILIDIHALRGKIQIDKETEASKKVEAYLEGKVIDERFLAFEQGEGIKRPIELPEAYYLALSDLVSRIGKVKDRGHDHEMLAAAYQQSGVAPSSAKAHEMAKELLERNGRTVEWEAEAQSIFAEMNNAKILKKLRQELESQR